MERLRVGGVDRGGIRVGKTFFFFFFILTSGQFKFSGWFCSHSWQEQLHQKTNALYGNSLFTGQREHSVFGTWAFGEKDFCYKESPQQTELINSVLQPPPLKMIPPTAQEHLGMFSANVITASVSGQLFKEPLLLLSHFNTWWCHGPLWGCRNSSNQLPLMTFSFNFFLSPPFAQFFLPLFLSLVHNWGSLYGLIKQPPPIGSLCL